MICGQKQTLVAPLAAWLACLGLVLGSAMAVADEPSPAPDVLRLTDGRAPHKSLDQQRSASHYYFPRAGISDRSDDQKKTIRFADGEQSSSDSKLVRQPGSIRFLDGNQPRIATSADAPLRLTDGRQQTKGIANGSGVVTFRDSSAGPVADESTESQTADTQTAGTRAPQPADSSPADDRIAQKLPEATTGGEQQSDPVDVPQTASEVKSSVAHSPTADIATTPRMPRVPAALTAGVTRLSVVEQEPAVAELPFSPVCISIDAEATEPITVELVTTSPTEAPPTDRLLLTGGIEPTTHWSHSTEEPVVADAGPGHEVIPADDSTDAFATTDDVATTDDTVKWWRQTPEERVSQRDDARQQTAPVDQPPFLVPFVARTRPAPALCTKCEETTVLMTLPASEWGGRKPFGAAPSGTCREDSLGPCLGSRPLYSVETVLMPCSASETVFDPEGVPNTKAPQATSLPAFDEVEIQLVGPTTCPFAVERFDAARFPGVPSATTPAGVFK